MYVCVRARVKRAEKDKGHKNDPHLSWSIYPERFHFQQGQVRVVHDLAWDATQPLITARTRVCADMNAIEGRVCAAFRVSLSGCRRAQCKGEDGCVGER